MSTLMRRLIDMASMPLTEQAFQRKKVVQIVEDAEYTVLTHAICLTALRIDEGVRKHWKVEIRAQLANISQSYLKGGGKLRFIDYWQALFANRLEPDQIGVKVVGKLYTGYLAHKYPDVPRNGLSDADVFVSLKSWYEGLCKALSRDEDFEPWLARL